VKKKILFISLLVVSILLVLITGCSEKTKAEELKTGRYVVPGNELELSPCVVLKENNEYVFIRNSFTSFVPIGNYSIDDNKLILNAGESEAYIFTIDGERLIFESSGNIDALVGQGTVFVFYDDETFNTEIKVTPADTVN